VIHSRLTGAERFEIWQRVVGGECRIVLGPRSAIFSPVVNLRLIIVDEEQDDSYKQGEKPRYHARHAALMRGKQEGLTVVLGSATPSAESFHHALESRYAYLSLPSRVGGGALPKIEYVDLRNEPMEAAMFSARLLERLEHHVRKGHQSILFLNKRGHARFVQCNACGWIARCRNCDIALTFHRVADRLRCHYCGYGRRAVSRCDACGGARLFFAGAGTQRVELDLASLLPGVGILRMDADTTAGKEGHRRVLEQFGTGRYPILIGTQMVAKGHHFPGINLVGVLHAEESLNYPDFRSSERTFQQLTQVAGRAGRAGSEAEVVIQTFTPEHHVFAYLSSHDYAGFMREELEVRRKLRYPPFSRIVLASCSATGKDALHRVVESWASEMRRRFTGSRLEVLGPVSPPVERVKNRYREHVMIKGTLTAGQKNEMLETYRKIAGRERGGRGVELRWDVDPESFA
jgi:primosomal protein N' (replication factor Y)